MKKRTDIGYHDYIVSLYYDPENPLSRTESMTRSVTFQVTDDCCMNCSYCLTGDTHILMSDLAIQSTYNIF